ncbi:uncharacterized protein LOC129942989 [Eupeodes corollae]|uniref:uncharacterized protein LOC129942989 n=1 Tax=Eupeodes corollae TaxID=290404 RepID=UPI00249261FB|nr:uncharacterized protein LOC129942989 [Eupeodes corollae]
MSSLACNFLQKVNALAKEKKIINIKDLSPVPQKIIRAFKCNTKYGRKVLLELEDGNVFLPTCYESLSDEDLEKMNRLMIKVTKSSSYMLGIRFIMNDSKEIVEERRFRIVSREVTTVKRFNIKGNKINFKIKPIPIDEEPTTWVRDAIEGIAEFVFKEIDGDDKVGVTFSGEGFSLERGSGWINFKSASEFQTKDFWDMIQKIFQSNSKGLNTDTFSMNVTTVKVPKGRGNRRGSSYYNNFDEECAKRKGIITIKNTDNLCLPRALFVAKAFANKTSDFNKIIKDNFKVQTNGAYQLIKDACVEVPEDGCGIPELHQFQNYLIDFKITVFQYGTKGRSTVFEGVPANPTTGKRINLIFNKNHFNVITSLTSAFCCSYFCEECLIPYQTKGRHKCVKACPQCQEIPDCKQVPKETKCEDCNRSFRGQQCFDNHKASTSSKKALCDKIQKCFKCLKTIGGNRKHTCNEFFCARCKKFVLQDHFCYILPDKRTPRTENCLYIFYDLESQQEHQDSAECMEEEEEDGVINKIHKPNLAVLQQRCSSCIEVLKLHFCNVCGFRQHILSSNVISNLIHYIMNMRQKFKNVIVIAHNGQAYDHQFVLNYFLTETIWKPELIMRGSKIILMQIANIKFLDSLNYFPMALSKLPKAFDLDPTYKKGYFPHFFNTLENENYAGKLPPLKYYAPDAMKSEERKIFLTWYNEHKNDNFVMKQELTEYCISDVKILADTCLKFRKLFLAQSNVEPFLEATTIASACSLVYRRNFLKEDTIGLIPRKGYRLTENQSKKAIQWLIWESKLRKISLKHAANGKEVKIAGLKVDGFCEETQQIFEFHGCYYHGHPVCLKHKRDDSLSGDKYDTLNQRYQRTISKTEHLKSFGYDVVEMWGCDFERLLSFMDHSAVEFLENHHLLTSLPLDPREAFYGGRTGNTVSFYKCQKGEKIKYIDVCSLYPWVCKYGKFPIKHPKVHTDVDICSRLTLKNISGIIKCTILPPQNLFHPVLPIKQNHKLIFSLCKTCSAMKSKEEFCSHSDKERSITGTWVIEEVVKAIEKGYKLLEIIEIWEYEVVQYNKNTHSKGLFDRMMDQFLKIKQEASGWPTNCTTENEKKAYILDFLEKENIKMDYEEITKNEGKRSLAKLILNSFWGKFGQRENQTKTIIVNNPADLYDMVTNPSLLVCNILPINEKNVVVNYQHKTETAEMLNTVNVCIAAYTTTQARLKLYEYLDKLGQRVLYYDTDSIIYTSREGECDPETGVLIGDMTDELECYGPGSYISEFVSGGPKNYAYKVFSTNDNTEHTVCVVNRKEREYPALCPFSEVEVFNTTDKFIKERHPSQQHHYDHNVGKIHLKPTIPHSHQMKLS